ncbi:RcnB family protein [Massilia sp. PWRC2]|uniref:RcnB family protein n=1 Tax=Massilia sp. PWRC2 TaxID=2804626 RepID=UPI003CF9C26D
MNMIKKTTKKTTIIASALLALSLAASGTALAQRNDHGNDRNDRGQQQDDSRNDHGARGNDNDRNDNNRNDARANDNRGRNYDARNFRRDDSRGGGPRHDMRRGQRLSQEYRDNRYVVNDWRARRLSAPPRGQHWVQAGDDYVLAAIATGIITQILLSN